jgi:hypothetical protein
MKVQQIGVGAVFIGAVVAGLAGAGSAQAAPGISFDNGTEGKGALGIGDQSNTGAIATATKGNTAIAVSLFSPAQATVGDNAAGSTAVAVGISSKSGSTSKISGNAKGGGAYTLDGHTSITGDANGTQVFNVWNENITANGTAGATTTLAVCDTQLTAQDAQVKVADGCN